MGTEVPALDPEPLSGIRRVRDFELRRIRRVFAACLAGAPGRAHVPGGNRTHIGRLGNASSIR